MGMLSWAGLWASRMGWRLRSLEDWMEEMMGLMC